MPSFLDNFLTPLRSNFTKAAQTVQPLFVDAMSRMGTGVQEVGRGLGDFYKQPINPIYDKYLPGISAFSKGGVQEYYKQSQDPTSQMSLNRAESIKPMNIASAIGPGMMVQSGGKLPIFKGTKNLTTKVLENLKGKDLVSRQFIEDSLKMQGLKKGEIESAKNALESFMPKAEIKVKPKYLDYYNEWDMKDSRIKLPKNLYHATSIDNLDSIKKYGLRTDWDKYAKYSNEANSSGNIFLSKEQMPDMGGDNPIMLRVNTDKISLKNLKIDDQLGGGRGDIPSWFVHNKNIKPENLEIQIGNKWEPLVKNMNDIAQEARKYKTAEEFVNSQFSKKPEYGMSHRPSFEGMPPSYNLLEGETLPRDVYTHPDFSIASGRIRSGDKASNESWNALQKIKNKPDAEITVYRAGRENKLNIGDWVTFSKNYAKQSLEGDVEKVYSFKVKAKDVIFAGDDINEFGYYPKSQLTDIWNEANKVSDKIPVKEFAQKVESELLPLKRTDMGAPHEGQANLPNELRGNVANYSEHVYESPIKTSAGGVHFNQNQSKNYFGHTRVEDLATDGLRTLKGEPITGNMIGGKAGNIRRVIEVQSDLYQKGNLEKEVGDVWRQGSENETFGEIYRRLGNGDEKLGIKKAQEMNEQELKKLFQYNDPTAHFRMVREEVKQAAIDGKTKLQFPTGETAMKIEGLGETQTWFIPSKKTFSGKEVLEIKHLKVGQEVENFDNSWIITDVLGDGKFKAVPKLDRHQFELEVMNDQNLYNIAQENNLIRNDGSGLKYEEAKKNNIISNAIDKLQKDRAEQFDISGKVDTNNPIYKFYQETLGKYLTNKYKARLITDAQGVSWYELNVPKEAGKAPVEAFGLGVLPFLPNNKKEKQELFINK